MLPRALARSLRDPVLSALGRMRTALAAGQVLEFRLCRAIRLPWFLTPGGSVSHARSWANREALPACDTYLTA